MIFRLSNVISNIRIIATIVIVLYHCTCPYYTWQWEGYIGNYQISKYINIIFLHILSDTMLPTFFMLSGILYYGRTNFKNICLNEIWKKFDRLCIPLCIITSICVWLKNLGLHESIDGHLWFIKTLFLFCNYSANHP